MVYADSLRISPKMFSKETSQKFGEYTVYYQWSCFGEWHMGHGEIDAISGEIAKETVMAALESEEIDGEFVYVKEPYDLTKHLEQVTPTHIAAASTHTACGIGRPDPLNRSPAVIRQPDSVVPRQNIDLGQHSRLPDTARIACCVVP